MSQSQPSPKEKELLSNDFAYQCDECGAVVFEWWDGCSICEGEDVITRQSTFDEGVQ